MEDRDKNLVYDEILNIEPPTDGKEGRPVVVLMLRLAAYLGQLRFLDALARHTILRRTRDVCLDVAKEGQPGHIVIRDFRYLAVTNEPKAYDLKTGTKVESLPIGVTTLAIDLMSLLHTKQEEA